MGNQARRMARSRRVARTRGERRGGESHSIFIVLCFSERIYSLFSKSARRIVEGEKGPKRPKKGRFKDERKGKIYMPEGGRTRRVLFFKENVFFIRELVHETVIIYIIITITRVSNCTLGEISIKSEVEKSEKGTRRRYTYDGAPEEWKRIARGRKIVGARCTSWKYRESNDNRVDRVNYPTYPRIITSIDRFALCDPPSPYDAVTHARLTRSFFFSHGREKSRKDRNEIKILVITRRDSLRAVS